MEIKKAIAQLESQFGARGFDLSYKTLPGTLRGSTSGYDRTTVIDPGQSPLDRVDTLAHELSHVVLKHGVSTRLVPNPIAELFSSDPDPARVEGELEAQLSAGMILKGLGIDDSAHTRDYLASWTHNGHGGDVVDRAKLDSARPYATWASNQVLRALNPAYDTESVVRGKMIDQGDPAPGEPWMYKGFDR